ncbi:type IV toxin-antitoxin system AbiEi family antitoxin domain-containing protein [bacterium]|nr:type IV toxin-antitoxin system AbiEi family antitoxin domain-containing protein [bacterium]
MADIRNLDILEKLVEKKGPIFTVEDAYNVAEQLSLTPAQMSKTLSKMSKSNWLARLKRGTYLVQSSLLSEEIHPFAIAQALVSPIAISHWSALSYHGFTTQIPPMVQASTPAKVVTPEMRSGKAYRPRGTAAWRVLNIEIEYIHVSEARFWGFTYEWVSSWHRVPITDPERTILDLIARSDLFGGILMAIETINANLEKIDLPKLVNYALRYNVGSYIKRLGWILEINNVQADILRPLQDYPTQNYYLLNPQGRKQGAPISRWNLYNNLRGGTDE